MHIYALLSFKKEGGLWAATCMVCACLRSRLGWPGRGLDMAK